MERTEIARVKQETTDGQMNDKRDIKNGTAENGLQFDYNKLYGDLCHKLLSTPVTEIFSGSFKSGVSTSSPANDVIPGILQSHVNGVTLNIPSYSSPTLLPAMTGSPEIKSEIFGGLYSQSGVLDSMACLGASTSFSPVTSPNEMKPVANKRHSGDTTEERNTAMDRLAETHEPLDIQRLVEEFRVTLERYGVSQRFAARFIMADTSQGNLSFLMEKGRVKRWEELSPRGRVPYIKMRMWLDSREEQVRTLTMLKYSQEARKSGPREAYNRRERFSMFQLHVLCRLFEENPNPAMNVRNAVAERLNIPLDRVNVWFQNQRARGFPAKRILQQQNGVYSSTGLEHETEASKIISSCASEQASAVSLQTMPDKLPPNMADYLLHIPLSGECTGNYHSQEQKPDVRQLNNTKVKTEPHIQVKTESPHSSPPAFISQCSKYSPTFLTSPVITSPVMTSHRRTSNSPATDTPCSDQPLDLSTGSTMVQPAHKHTSTKNGKFSPHSSVSATNVCDISDVKHLTGASKRKRGFTPQQIISKHYITSQVNSIEDNNVQSPKRRRKSNDDEDTDEFEYDYVITSDDIKPSSPLNDNGATQTKSDCERELNQHLLDNDTPLDQENVHPRAISKLADGDKENVGKFDPNVKQESLLQAMCASIVMDERNSSVAEGYVMEPELD